MSSLSTLSLYIIRYKKQRVCFLPESPSVFHILLQVEVKAIPVSQKKTSLQQEQAKKVQRIPGSPATAASPSSDMTFGGLPSPKLDSSYEPMIVKEARYIAITMMKVNYCHFINVTIRFSVQSVKRHVNEKEKGVFGFGHNLKIH